MASGSDSEPEEYTEACDTLQSTKLKRAIKDCLEMSPKKEKLKSAASQGARAKLLGLQNQKDGKSSNIILRSGAKGDDRKKVEDSFREISQDLSGINKKLDGILECVLGILERVDDLEERMTLLESSSAQTSASSSYSEVLASNLEEGNKRIGKLEYAVRRNVRREFSKCL